MITVWRIMCTGMLTACWFQCEIVYWPAAHHHQVSDLKLGGRATNPHNLASEQVIISVSNAQLYFVPYIAHHSQLHNERPQVTCHFDGVAVAGSTVAGRHGTGGLQPSQRIFQLAKCAAAAAAGAHHRQLFASDSAHCCAQAPARSNRGESTNQVMTQLECARRLACGAPPSPVLSLRPTHTIPAAPSIEPIASLEAHTYLHYYMLWGLLASICCPFAPTTSKVGRAPALLE